MKVLNFSYITTDNNYDLKYDDGHAWSRCYEYDMCVFHMKKHLKKNSSVHNTSWGFEGVHITFKETLDSIYPNCIHSDIKESNLDKTTIYDISKHPPENFKNKFDCVVNISTLEEVPADHSLIFDNLFSQVKPGGIMICTFDMPGLQLEKIENKLKTKIKDVGERVTANNSVVTGSKDIYGNRLSCGFFVVEKNKSI